MRKLLLSLTLLAAAFSASAALTPLPGVTLQVANANSFFEAVSVRVTDANGAAVAGASVAYPTGSAAGYLVGSQPSCPTVNNGTCTVLSDANGVATLPPVAAISLGTHLLQLHSNYGDADIILSVVASYAPAAVQILDGDGQVTQANARFARPLRLRAVRGDVGIPGIPIYVTSNASSPAPLAFATGDEYGTGALTLITDIDGVVETPPIISLGVVGDGRIVASWADFKNGTAPIIFANFTVSSFANSPTFDVADMWWGGPQQSGWGMTVAQRNDRLFPVLFAYDDAGNPTWWLSEGSWPQPATLWSSTLYRTRSAPYYAYNAAAFTRSSNNELMSLQFTGLELTGIHYQNLSGATPKIVEAPLMRFAYAPAVPKRERAVGDIWWGGPSQNGWGLSIMEDSGNLFLTWFTYDASGNATWFAMPSGAWTTALTWSGPIYKTHANGWANGFDPSKVTQQQVGTFSVTFNPDSTATFAWNLEGHKGTNEIRRFTF